MRFVDTNVLLYAVSTNPAESSKKQRAITLLEDPELVLSVQVMQEFFVQATRPGRTGALTHEQAERFLRSLRRFRILENTLPTFDLALEIHGRHSLSFWDALIVAAAVRAGCRELLTEDLSDGTVYHGVVVVNPFART